MKKFLRASHFVLLNATLVYYLFEAVILYADPKKSVVLSPMAAIQMVLTIGMLVFAAIYLVQDHQKNAALFYKIFLYTFSITTLLTAIIKPFADGGLLLWVAALSCALLATVKNYGKAASLITAVILLITRSALLILNVISAGRLAISGEICNTLLALTVLVMVGEKYIDKAERGSK